MDLVSSAAVIHDEHVRGFAKFLAFLLLLIVIVAGVAWFWAGRQPGPAVQFRQPDKYVGQTSELDLMVETPQGQLSRLDVTIEQNGKSIPVFTLSQPTQATTRQDSANRFYVMRPIGKRAIPELQAGAARIVVHAARPVLRGMRQAETETTRDVQVRLDPPRVAVVSTFHYVNLGGAEFVVYRATPADVESGVRVGDRVYPGFPGSAVGIKSDPAIRVAFFALAGRLFSLAKRAIDRGSRIGWLTVAFLTILLLDAVTRDSLTGFPSAFLGMLLVGVSLAAAEEEHEELAEVPAPAR